MFLSGNILYIQNTHIHEHTQTHIIYGLTSVNHKTDTEGLFLSSTNMLTKVSKSYPL